MRIHERYTEKKKKNICSISCLPFWRFLQMSLPSPCGEAHSGFIGVFRDRMEWITSKHTHQLYWHIVSVSFFKLKDNNPQKMLIMTKSSPQPFHKSLHTFNNKEPKCLFKHFYSIRLVINRFQHPSNCRYSVRDSSGLWDSGKIQLLRKSTLSCSDIDCNSWSITYNIGDMMTFQRTVYSLYYTKDETVWVSPEHNHIPKSSNVESWQRAAHEVWMCHNSTRLRWKWEQFWKMDTKEKNSYGTNFQQIWHEDGFFCFLTLGEPKYDRHKFVIFT